MASFDRITSLPREEFVRTVLISIVRHGGPARWQIFGYERAELDSLIQCIRDECTTIPTWVRPVMTISNHSKMAFDDGSSISFGLSAVAVRGTSPNFIAVSSQLSPADKNNCIIEAIPGLREWWGIGESNFRIFEFSV